jgi:hypothetical protein
MLIYLSVNLNLCPPSSVAKRQRKIIKQIRAEEFKYGGEEPAETNYTQYDPAQIYEMANYPNNIRDLVDDADRRIKERIQPKKAGTWHNAKHRRRWRDCGVRYDAHPDLGVFGFRVHVRHLHGRSFQWYS